MSSITSMSSSYASMLSQMKSQSAGSAGRSKHLDSAFSKLDSANTGSFDVSALTTAVNNALSSGHSKSSTSFSTSDIETAFSTMDSDGDGKVTKQEFTSTISQLRGPHHPHRDDSSSDEGGMNRQEKQAASGIDRMPPPPPGGGRGMHVMGGMKGMYGMPPPPADGRQGNSGTDDGFSREELLAKLNEIRSTDSKRSEFMSNVINNFSAADSDGNGKVTFAEALAINKTLSDANGSLPTSTGETITSNDSLGQQSVGNSTRADEISYKALRQVMKMVDAYSANLDKS